MAVDKGGRPTKLTPESRRRVCQAVRDGNTRDAAARYAGIKPQTFFNWLARGRKAQSGLYREFFDAVKKAENDALMASVKVIRKAAPKNWTAAAWWLERRHHKAWGRKDTTKVVGAGKGGEVVIAVLGPGLSAEDL